MDLLCKEWALVITKCGDTKHVPLQCVIKEYQINYTQKFTVEDKLYYIERGCHQYRTPVDRNKLTL